MHKTIKIAALVAKVNDLNQHSICPPEVRRGWNSLLEDVLHGADAYVGFGYLSVTEVPRYQTPGITGEAPNFQFPDETRRRYIVHSRLQSNTP